MDSRQSPSQKGDQFKLIGHATKQDSIPEEVVGAVNKINEGNHRENDANLDGTGSPNNAAAVMNKTAIQTAKVCRELSIIDCE